MSSPAIGISMKQSCWRLLYERGRGEDSLFRVPCGTIIRDAKTGCSLSELLLPGERVILAKGGRPGIGNTHNRTVTKGGEGQERDLLLELKF